MGLSTRKSVSFFGNLLLEKIAFKGYMSMTFPFLIHLKLKSGTLQCKHVVDVCYVEYFCFIVHSYI